MLYEDEFRALLRPSASDYDELLRAGNVTARPDDPDAWRADIRARARADKLRVRTGTADSDPSVVWAYLAHLDSREWTEAEEKLAHAHMRVASGAFDTATELGHDPMMLRAEKGQGAAICKKCRAPAYLDWREEPPIIDGPLVEHVCTADE
jgi:hypothetical protein